MASRNFRPAWLCLASTLVCGGEALAQAPVSQQPERYRAPFLNLSGPTRVATRYDHPALLAGGRALSTAAADFDEDGMPDLAGGFATPAGGAVTIHRGNVDALWPYSALRGTEPPAFLPNARVFALPDAPDFLAAGDFDADGHQDLIAARAGSPALYFLQGDGHGGFAEPRRLALPGNVTAMTSGDIDRADGLADLMVALTGPGGSQVLVFESPEGAFRATPEVFPLNGEAAALAVIPLDGGIRNGLAVAAGRELLLIHGRDRKLTRSQAERDSVPEAAVTRQSFPFALRSLAVGRFSSSGQDLAALGDDGQIHLLERSDAAEPIVTVDPAPGLHARSHTAASLAAPTRLPGPLPRTTALTPRAAIGLPPSVNPAAARLVTAHVAATGRDSLVVVDPTGSRLHIVSHSSRTAAAGMAVSTSLDGAGSPAAVQAMRINKDALSDLVVFSTSQLEPVVHTTAPDHIYVVTNTSDDLGTPGSLRQNLYNAPLVGGTAEIDFNIPATDPNRDPTTGVFTIQPVGQNNLMALPFLDGLTIDGYTQPGTSPNTLANGDNAKLLVEINGSMAGLGPSGLYLGGGGNLVRGLVVTNFQGVPSSTDPRYIDGGGAIDIESDFNLVEGNFIGIDAGGTFSKPNSAGFFTPSGPATENGSTIGGTTPQARNLISGNRFEGIADSTIAFPNTFFILGNYIGTDRTGAKSVGNGYVGVDLIGYNALVGDADAGTGNLISGNTSFNVVAQILGSGPQGNTLQGNLIGTDLTGTLPLSNITGAGVGLAGSAGDTVGGTIPATRNIISASYGSGILFVGGNENDIVEGNYIGLDITGSKAIPNGGPGISFATDFRDVLGASHSGGPVSTTTIGGEAAGAANVISGNAGGGVSIISKSGFALNNVISGNLIGTDATGLKPLGNTGDGVQMTAYASANTVGGSDPAAANVIAYNTGNGVRIDPGSPNTATFGVSSDLVIGNAIYSNGGAGVRIPSGTGNTVSRNLIYSNAALGIDIDAPGVEPNSSCQTNTAGANLLQDAPLLTAAAGNTFLTATATDPNGNTSEFSNCVAASLNGNLLSVAGTLNSLPNTTYTIEYFSNTTCDPTGFGQGKVYLGSATVTTAAGCGASLNTTLNLNNADLGVVYTSATSFAATTDESFTVATLVSNNGPIGATGVTWADPVPAGFLYLSATATQGSCAFANGVITCNLGNLPAGGTVTVTAYIVPTASAAFSNTVSVASATPDGNPANNSATITRTAAYNPYLHHLSPASVYTGSPALTLTLVGQGFTSTSQVTYGGVAYAATFVPNWNPTDCGLNLPSGGRYCTALTINIPASQLTAVATVPVNVVTTGIGAGSQTLNFNIVTPPVTPGPVAKFALSTRNPYPAGSPQLLTVTAEDANGLTATTYQGTVNLTSSDPAPTVFTAGGGAATLVFTASGAGQASTVVTLQTMGTQSLTATDASNPGLKGTLGGIVVTNGPAANMLLSGSPQATPPGQPFSLPLKVTVTDLYGNAVPNQVVTFTAPASGPGAVLSAPTATTNNLGVAGVTATANSTSGVYAVGVTFGAAVAGGGDNADVFLLTNGSGLATLTATAGTPQTAFLGQLFQTNLQARLLDGQGNPISGATVYFTSGSVNGATALVPASAVTNASGVVSVTANAPGNASAGTFPVTATAGGLTATFTLTEVAPKPVVLTVTGGSPQTTAVGTAFSSPLTVHVTDGYGTPRPGVVVTYIPPAAGAGATLSAGTASTDASGNAGLTATANSTLGTYNVSASVGGVTVDFVLTNSSGGSGAPASIAASAGTPQSQTVGLPFATPLKVLVKDASGTPLSGASVTFSAPAGGPSGTFTGPATVTTNGSGFATAPTFTANTLAGSFTVTATAGAVSATFSLTNLPGAPAAMSISAGNNQSATVNTAYGTALAVQLVDNYGNPAGAGYSVLFFAAAGPSGASAAFSGSTTVTTDSRGIATAPTLTANAIAGIPAALALYGALYQSFNLTNTASVPASLAAYAGTPQSAATGAAFAVPLSAKVTDAGGTPLAGFTVTFTAPSSAATAVLSSTSAITNASGIASVNATANSTAGSYQIAAAIGTHTASFSLTNTAVYGKCDLNRDGYVTVTDVRLMLNELLGGSPPANDINLDGVTNLVDGQIVINAALNLGCTTGK